MAQDPDGRGGLAAWNASRPPFLEADAVQRAGLFARQTGARLYIVHTSSRLALEEGRRAREAGTRITIETCPHYLTHSIEWPRGDIGKINPPLRERSDCEALWARDRGRRHRYGRDRSHPPRPVEQGRRNLEGVARLSRHRYAAAGPAERRSSQAQAPARPHRRARRRRHRPRPWACRIARDGLPSGSTPTSRIVDVESEFTPRRDHLHSSAGYSIYEGVPLRGRVRHTLVGGRFVLRDHGLVADAVGTGRFVPTAPCMIASGYPQTSPPSERSRHRCASGTRASSSWKRSRPTPTACAGTSIGSSSPTRSSICTACCRRPIRPTIRAATSVSPSCSGCTACNGRQMRSPRRDRGLRRLRHVHDHRSAVSRDQDDRRYPGGRRRRGLLPRRKHARPALRADAVHGSGHPALSAARSTGAA